MMDGALRPIRYPWERPPEAGQAIEVAPGILWMRLPLPMKLDHVNVYALEDGPGWTLIDTGFDTALTRDLWGDLLAGPLGGRPVTRVIVTHHHPDHVGLAGWFQTGHGAALWMTRTAWLYARMLQLDAQDRPTAESLLFYRRAGMPAEIYAERETQRPFNFADVVAPLPLGYRRVQQGQVLRIGAREWRVHIGNGHAPEQITLWSVADNLILGADQLLPSISPNVGIHATEPEADPLAEWLESCERLGTLAQEDHLVLPGHKLPFTGLPIRLRQLIDNHHSALDRLWHFLDTPRTAAECFPPLFKRSIGGAEFGLALVESLAHLQHLYLSGRALRETTPDGDALLWRRAP